MNSSESDAGCTAWRSSDSHGCTTDLVTESIVRLSDTFHIVTWNGTTASGRGGVGATASRLVFDLFISICSPGRLAAHSSSDTTCSLLVLVLVLVLVLLLSVSVVIVALILTIVVSAEAETGGTTWLVMHSHGCAAYFVSEDIECLSNT